MSRLFGRREGLPHAGFHLLYSASDPTQRVLSGRLRDQGWITRPPLSTPIIDDGGQAR